MLGLGKLLGLPVSLPMAGMKFVFKTVADLADQELNDESVVHEQLLLLQIQLEEGDLEEEEYAEQEAALFARLREIKARKRAAQEEAMPLEADVESRRSVVIETALDDE